jgi:putative RNA 2'-phosphotransferase
MQEGINKGSRQHVHLSIDLVTAKNVGSRHGLPVILEIDAEKMQAEGFKFYCSDNGVWLTDHIPAQYLIQLD